MLRNIKCVLRNYSIEFEPRKVIIDFEYAAFNAVKTVFPVATVSGCLFHFGQAIWRRVTKLGLKTLFSEDISFSNEVKKITALALVPLECVDDVWAQICSSLNGQDTRIDEFTNHIHRVWLSNEHPLYNRSVWSQFGDLRGRTNNYCEGFHSKINRLIHKTHPNFYEVLDILKTIQFTNQLELLRLLRGGEPKARKKNFVEQDKKINRLWQNYIQNGLSLELLVDGLKEAIKLNV
jgi:hypothetical protein